MKKRILLFVHNVIAHPFMEACYLIAFDNRHDWITSVGEALHDATIDRTSEPLPVAPTMTLAEFHAAAMELASRLGYGDATGVCTSADLWKYSVLHSLEPSYRICIVQSGNAISSDRHPNPLTALAKFEEILLLRQSQTTEQVTDMQIES